ncbi:conjugal transfer protein TraF [Acerihabitans arboris]|uniref:Conjugal transfer protein TraF n=1 Tax=Acerihabitans arboris TaxID=2691583 RepID=A0A845SJI8_9GAMM|nr:conjugal transfer protein TraF [Acerihabitans arboris]NDL61495.1 conjugal transfer protein TraF [Acerihabitans arboris]
MKRSGITQVFLSAGLLAAIPPALAAGNWTEARNDAMGGTGVSSSHYGAAALVNPALLTGFGDEDDISIILPAAGGRVSDPDNLQDGIDNVQSAWDNLENEVNNGTGTPDSVKKFSNALRDISGDKGKAEAGVAGVITVPNHVLPFALVAKGWAKASVKAKVTDRDLAYLDAVQAGLVRPAGEDLDQLTSRAEGLAALVTEYGVAVAHPFNLAGRDISVGITPKLQRVATYNYNAIINHYDKADFRNAEYRRAENGANIDFGLSANITPDWIAGLAAQNLVARSVDTKEVNGSQDSFKIRPQVTAGTSWSNGLVTGAIDIDLTPASGFASQEKNQYAGVGAEINAWSWVQLRAGYRADMRHGDNNVVTAGIGLSPFGRVHLDVTGLVGNDRTYGAIAQLSYTF